MAEYLDPRDGYALVTFPDWQAPQPWWIEVPEGAECAHEQFISEHKVGFYKENHSWDHEDNIWVFEKRFNPYANRVIFWKRPTQPEELPFIDDEPPAHFVVRPKPRQRVYAVLSDPVPVTPAEAFAAFAAQFGAFWRDLGAAAKKLRDEGKL